MPPPDIETKENALERTPYLHDCARCHAERAAAGEFEKCPRCQMVRYCSTSLWHELANSRPVFLGNHILKGAVGQLLGQIYSCYTTLKLGIPQSRRGNRNRISHT